MLCIIVGILLAVLLYNVAIEKFGLASKTGETLFHFAIFFIIFGIAYGLFIPTGYKEPVLTEKIELVSFNNELVSSGEGKLFYVSVSADNTYSYRYEVNDKYNLGGKSYEIGTVSKNVTEIESSECDKAVLKVYKVKPKITFISFGLGASKTEYVFYVPEGTIQKEIALK